MANQHIIERIAGIQKMLMGIHAAGAVMSASSKGQERQQFIDHFLKQALPPIYRFGSGDATDASNHRSGQLDVVIEYPFAPNLPIGAENPTRLYLAEAVAAVVEVKSDVAGQWEEAKRTAEQLAPLQRNFSLSMSMGPPPTTTIPLYVVGYKGWKKIETLREKLVDCPSVRGILVIEDGLFCSTSGLEATGPAGLWALISDLFGRVSSLQSAISNPLAYLLSQTPSGIITSANLASCGDNYLTSISKLTDAGLASGGTGVGMGKRWE